MNYLNRLFFIILILSLFNCGGQKEVVIIKREVIPIVPPAELLTCGEIPPLLSPPFDDIAVSEYVMKLYYYSVNCNKTFEELRLYIETEVKNLEAKPKEDK
jgi:hypothetical protein